MRALAIALGVAVVAPAAVARADQLRQAGFAFELPRLGKAWEQEARGDLVVASDDSDTVPELQIFAFPARKEGPLAEIEGHLAAELARPGVSLAGDPVKTVKLGQASGETIADASVRVGAVTVNGEPAVFAIVQRSGHSLILLGVPKPGIFDRGAANFRAVVHGLQAARGWGAPATARGSGAAPAAPAPAAKTPAAKTDLPRLPDTIAVREVTATSTFADKARRDAYAAWRVLAYEQAADQSASVSIPATAWCEGKPDEGVGEAITIALAAPARIDAIRIAAGVWKTPKLFAANNQIAALEVALDGVPTAVKPPASRTWLEVPVGREVSTIAIKLAEVKPGKMNDSCLSGVELVRNRQALIPLLGVDGGANAELPRALAALQTALLAPGRPGLEKLLEFPFVNHDAAGFFMGAPAPIKHASWKAVDAACRAWDKAVERDKVDESKPVSCPRPADVDPADDRPAAVVSTGPGKIEVIFPSHREVRELWRLHWRDRGWRLSAIEYQ